MVANRKLVLAAVLLLVAGLFVWAWLDGGERSVHPIEQDVPVPENAK